MSVKRRKFTKGIRIKPNNTPTALDGEISVSSVDNKVKVTTEVPADFADLTIYNVGDKVRYTDNLNYICIQTTTDPDYQDPTDPAYWEVYERSIVTEDQTQTLTNKTIDATAATGTNTLSADSVDITYDDTATTTNPVGGTPLINLGDDVQEALDNVKIALDNQNEASEITYNPDGNNIIDPASDNVQLAIDDLDNDANLMRQTSGTAKGESDLGTFTGATISDNVTIKAGMQELETAHEAHVNETTDAHAASAISNVPSGNLAATDVQTALDELQTDIDTRATNTALTAHVEAVSDAHDASAITNTPSGNLAATDVQGALNELQTDIDTRALSSGGTIDNATITNSSIETPSRLDVKQSTEADLIDYAAGTGVYVGDGPASDGQIVFATDTQEMYQIIDGELKAIGGGGATSFEITQTTHGFSVGQGIYHNGTNWVLGQADAVNTLAYFVVVEVSDADTFIAADFGRIESPAHGYTVGQYYFLSDSVAGQAVTTEPSIGFSNPLFYVEDANILQVKCLRPSAIDGGITLDQVNDVSVPSPVDGQALIYNNISGLWEAQDVAGTAADISYDNSSSGLAAADAQAAIDEVELRVDTAETDIRELEKVKNINYITNPDFEDGISGWSSSNINLNISHETVAPLRGTGSLKIDKDSPSTFNNYVSIPFTVDPADLAKKLTISFDYDASNVNYLDDDMIIEVIADPSGTPVTIKPNGEGIKAGKGTHYAQFQTDAVITDYELRLKYSRIFVSPTDIITIDNVSVGPREVVKSAVMTDFRPYDVQLLGQTTDPTINGTPNAQWRRVGDSMEIKLSFQQSSAGTAGSGIYAWSLPDGYKIDFDKVDSGGATSQGNLGSLSFRVGTINGDGVVLAHDFGTKEGLSMYVDYTTVGSSYISNGFLSTANATWRISFTASVPIQGWSSNAVTSEDLGGREVYVSAYMTGGHSISGSFQDMQFNGKINDTTNSFDTSTYTFTAPESGNYHLACGIEFNTSSPVIGQSLDLFFNINSGATYRKFARYEIPTSPGQVIQNMFSGSTDIYLEKGDTVKVVGSETFTNNPTILAGSLTDIRSFFTIHKLASPQTILETETVAARYTSDSGQSIPNLAETLVKFEDIDYDTHNAYDTSTGIFTVPVSGFYDISAVIGFSTANVGAYYAAIYIDGSIKARGSVYYCSADRGYGSLFNKINLNKGQEVSIYIYHDSGASRTLWTIDSSWTYFSIARIK